MKKITIPTREKRQVIDITQLVEEHIQGSISQSQGVCHVMALHTTVSIGIADLDPGTDLDMLDAFEALVPKLSYRHPHDPSHVGDHILSTLVGQNVTLPFSGGRLTLGTWQRVVLFEFDGPRDRTVVLSLVASTA